MRLCSAKERGNGRLGRVHTGLLACTLPIVTKEHANAHRRDALCPSPKIQKQAAFGIILVFGLYGKVSGNQNPDVGFAKGTEIAR
jgi:hypothetical protein